MSMNVCSWVPVTIQGAAFVVTTVGAGVAVYTVWLDSLAQKAFQALSSRSSRHMQESLQKRDVQQVNPPSRRVVSQKMAEQRFMQHWLESDSCHHWALRQPIYQQHKLMGPVKAAHWEGTGQTVTTWVDATTFPVKVKGQILDRETAEVRTFQFEYRGPEIAGQWDSSIVESCIAIHEKGFWMLYTETDLDGKKAIHLRSMSFEGISLANERIETIEAASLLPSLVAESGDGCRVSWRENEQRRTHNFRVLPTGRLEGYASTIAPNRDEIRPNPLDEARCEDRLSYENIHRKFGSQGPVTMGSREGERAGNTLVAWVKATQDRIRICGRLFSANGTAVGPERQLARYLGEETLRQWTRSTTEIAIAAVRNGFWLAYTETTRSKTKDISLVLLSSRLQPRDRFKLPTSGTSHLFLRLAAEDSQNCTLTWQEENEEVQQSVRRPYP